MRAWHASDFRTNLKLLHTDDTLSIRIRPDLLQSFNGRFRRRNWLHLIINLRGVQNYRVLFLDVHDNGRPGCPGASSNSCYFSQQITVFFLRQLEHHAKQCGHATIVVSTHGLIFEEPTRFSLRSCFFVDRSRWCVAVAVVVLHSRYLGDVKVDAKAIPQGRSLVRRWVIPGLDLLPNLGFIIVVGS